MKKITLFLWLFLILGISYSYGQNLKPKLLDTNGAVQTIVQSGDTVYIGGSFTQVGYNTGAVAKLTTGSDVPNVDLQKVSGQVTAAVADGGGGWFLGGSFSYTVGGQTRYYLAHLLPDGTFDGDFDPQPNSTVAKVLLSGSTLYAAGSFSQIGGQSRQYLAALSASTGQASSFNPQPDNQVLDMVLSGSTLYAAGYFSLIGGREQRYFAPLSTSTGKATQTLDFNSYVNSLATDGTNLYLGGSFSQIGYYTGSLAKLTTNSAVPDRGFPKVNGQVAAAVPDGDGGWFLGGSFSYTVGGQTRYYLAHLLPDGTFDGDFDPQPNSTVAKVLLSGSTLYAAGSFSQIGGQSRQYLAALSASTGQASSFNPQPDNQVLDMVLSGSTLYAAGYFSLIGGQSRRYLAALSTSTGQASTWGPEPNSYVYSLAMSGSTLYAGGSFSQIGGQNRQYLAALSTSTGQASGWAPEPNSTVQKLLLSGSTLYAAGSFSQIGGQSRQYLAALSASTGQASSFNPQPDNQVLDMVLSGSTLYAGGYFTQIGGQNRRYLAALSTSTGQASSWAPEPDGYVNALAVSGGDVLAGGSFNFLQDQGRQYLASLKLSTGEVTAFDPQPNSNVQELLLSGSTLYAAGGFSQIGGQSRQYLAALSTSTGQASSFNPQPNNQVFDMALSGSTLYAGGYFTQIGGQNRRYLAALSTSTGQASGWAPEPDGPVYAVAVSGGDVLAGGSFSFLQEQDRQYLAAFKASTGNVLPWNPGANNVVEVLKISGSTLYAGGSFTQLGGLPRDHIGAMNRANGNVTSWNPSVNGTVYDLAVDGSTVYIGGGFTSAGGQNRNYLAALERSSNTATSWNPSANSTVHALAVNGSTIYAGGSFSQIGEQERRYIAAFNKSNGNLTSWNPAANSTVQQLVLDGSLVYAGGSFTQIGGQQRQYLAALSINNAQATDWNPQLNSSVLALVKAQDYVFAGGYFTRVGEQAVDYFAMLDAATGEVVGSLPQFDSYVNALSYSAAAKTLYVGGQFTMVGTKNRSHLASFEVTPTNEVSDQTITFNPIGDKTLADDPVTLVATASSGLPVSFSILSGPATLSGDKMTFTGTGTVKVRASQAGNDSFNPAPDVDRSFNVTKASQTISFESIPDKTLGDPNFALNATASSGLPLSYSVVSGPASLTGNVITMTGTGTVVIEATQEGNETYAAATAVRRSFTVGAPTLEAQAITFPAIEGRTYGEGPLTLGATASSGLAVSYQVISGPATVSGNTLTITGAGNVTVRATQSGNSTYAPASPVDRSFTVEKASQTIAFTTIPTKTLADSPVILEASASSGLPVSYSIVSGPATVSGSTLVLTGIGTVVVRASQAGSANFQAATPVQQSFKVEAAPKQDQTITLSAIAGKTFGDAPFTLNAEASSGLPVNLTVVSGPATVSGNTITLTGAGTVVVEASQAGNDAYNAASPVRRSFTVGKANQSLTFATLPEITFGDEPITLEATSSSGLPVSFQVVSGPATASGNVLTVTGAGNVRVRATQAGNVNYNAASSVEQSVVVKKASQAITFAALSNKTFGDTPFALSASATSGLPVNYSVVAGPATINGNMVTLTGPGTVTVRAYQAGNSNYQAAQNVDRSFVVLNPEKKSQTITFAALSNRTFGDGPVTLSATASSGLPVSFSLVSGPASLSGNILTLTGAGTVIVQALQSGNEVYNAAPPVERSLEVRRAAQHITFAALPDKTYGDSAFVLSAAASSGLPVSFSVVSGPATITGDTVKLTGAGNVVIRAEQAGSDNYLAAAPVERSFSVRLSEKMEQSITFVPITDKTQGDLPFTISATASSGLPVAFSVVSGPATIAGNTVSLTGNGKVVIEARQEGNEEFSAAPPVRQRFTVAPAQRQEQTITFVNIPDKTFGDPPFTISATASSGLPVGFRVVSGPATLSGDTVTLTGAGIVVIEASQPGDSTYNAASPVTQAFEVNDVNAPELAVQSFTLVNALDEQDLMPLADGDTINLAMLPTRFLNIRANTSQESGVDVYFELSGKQSYTRNELGHPFALFGDNDGDYKTWLPAAGHYTLTATPSTDGGAKGTPATISFTVVNKATPKVTGFTLVNALDEQDLMPLTDGDTINLAMLPTRFLNIRANTSQESGVDVYFELSGKQSYTRNELGHPFALFGDNDGDYKTWLPAAGHYTLTATPSTDGGAKGTPATISFTVVKMMAASSTGSLQATAEQRASAAAYPNPTSEGRIRVLLPQEVQGELGFSLHSSEGAEVTGGALNLAEPTKELDFDFSSQMSANGVYFLRLKANGIQTVLKVVRQ